MKQCIYVSGMSKFIPAHKYYTKKCSVGVIVKWIHSTIQLWAALSEKTDYTLTQSTIKYCSARKSKVYERNPLTARSFSLIWTLMQGPWGLKAISTMILKINQCIYTLYDYSFPVMNSVIWEERFKPTHPIM